MSFLNRLLGRDGVSQAAIDAGWFALNVSQRPIQPLTGIYTVSHRFAIIAAQAANSRLFTIRNTGANWIVPLKLRLQWLQTAAHTAAIEDSLDLYYATGFSVQDTTNTVTPSAVRHKSTMTAAPGNVELRGVTQAGAAAGMTGGTVSKAGTALAMMSKWLLLAQPTAGLVDPQDMSFLSDMLPSAIHPYVLANNEGMILENRVLLGAAAGSSVYLKLIYGEFANYPF